VPSRLAPALAAGARVETNIKQKIVDVEISICPQPAVSGYSTNQLFKGVSCDFTRD
jgi:hypothetical protein